MRFASRLASLAFLLGAAAAVAQLAPPGQPMPHDYGGVQTHIDGIWITPVPNAPFSATVQIVSHQKLLNGTEHVIRTMNHIARNSAGVIRNERRQLVPASSSREPHVLSVHLFDPNSRLNTYLDPLTHLARQSVLPAAPRTPAAQLPPEQQARLDAARGLTVTDLGAQHLDGVELRGTRKTRIVPAALSGTGQPVTVTDDEWYCPELHVYLIIRHDDPRTGEQMVAVTAIQRSEPPAEDLAIPVEYKVVDETPPAQPPGGTPPRASPQGSHPDTGDEINLATQMPR